MSQQRLAEIAGCSIQHVRLLEAGYSPRAERAPQYRAICAALGLPALPSPDRVDASAERELTDG